MKIEKLAENARNDNERSAKTKSCLTRTIWI